MLLHVRFDSAISGLEFTQIDTRSHNPLIHFFLLFSSKRYEKQDTSSSGFAG